jgi:hypothetical protein
MPAELSIWSQTRKITAGAIVGLLIGAIPLALGYLSVTFYPLAVPLMALAYGVALVIIFIAVGCLIGRERRPVGLGMTAGVFLAVVAYALLMFHAAGSY